MKKLLLLFLVVFVSNSVFSQFSDTTSLLEPVVQTIEQTSIFDDNLPIDLTLKYDISSFMKNKKKGEYLDALLVVHINDIDSVVKKIRLKARGNFRRGHCIFPPIYLNFKTDPIKNTDLKEIKKMKLVTHCSMLKTYQDYIIKEYLAYKIYNQLTDLSFRVKLVNINYIDTGKKGRTYTKEGFLIEPIDLLIKRTKSVEVNGNFVNADKVIDEDMARVALFEYLIGNTDWRIKGGHNMKYIKLFDELSPKVTPVPYDFDFAGFVHTNYAKPQEWTSIKSVTEREYLGNCNINDEILLKTIDTFVRNKEKFYSIINDCNALSNKEKRRLLDFVKGFYNEAASPQLMLKTLKRECRDTDF